MDERIFAKKLSGEKCRKTKNPMRKNEIVGWEKFRKINHSAKMLNFRAKMFWWETRKNPFGDPLYTSSSLVLLRAFSDTREKQRLSELITFGVISDPSSAIDRYFDHIFLFFSDYRTDNFSDSSTSYHLIFVRVFTDPCFEHVMILYL